MSRAFGITALALVACSEPPQITLSIRTTAAVPCEIDSIRLVAKAAGTTKFEQRLKAGDIPVEITLWDETSSGMFDLELSGFWGDIEVMRVHGPLEFRGREAVEPVLLDRKCTPDQECLLSDAMAAARDAPRVSGSVCANVRRYQVTEAIEDFVDACGVTGPRMALDRGTRVVDLTDVDSELKSRLDASGFRFYGRPIRHIWVAKDGYMSFTELSPEAEGLVVPGTFDRELTQGGAPPPPLSVMAFWETLSLRSTGLCYALSGEPGEQQLRVTWPNACISSKCEGNRDNLNFTITLDEADDRIAITYGTMSAADNDSAHGLHATAGLVNGAPGCAAAQCVHDTGLCPDRVTPCGYAQAFSRTRYDTVPRKQFTPVIE